MFFSLGLASFVQLCDVPCFSSVVGPHCTHQCRCRTAHQLNSTTSEEYQHTPREHEGTWPVGTGDQLTSLDGESVIFQSLSVLMHMHPSFNPFLERNFFLPWIFFSRFKVELYLLKPSASSLHLLQQTQICPGPERLSEMPPSAVWGTVWITNLTQNLNSRNLFSQMVSSAYRPTSQHAISAHWLHFMFRFPSVSGPSFILVAVQSRLRGWFQP